MTYEIDAWLGEIPATRGPIGRPHTSRSGRMRKVLCDGCGCILYASAGALLSAGLPVCGCGASMSLPNLRDRAVVEWDALAAELESYGRDAYDAAMRELGYTDMIAPRTGERKSGLAQHRCEWEGGHCVKFTSSRYCDEHALDARAEMATSSRRAA